MSRFAWCVVGLICLSVGGIVAVSYWQKQKAAEPVTASKEVMDQVFPPPPDPPKKDPVPSDYVEVGGVYRPKSDVEPLAKADVEVISRAQVSTQLFANEMVFAFPGSYDR